MEQEFSPLDEELELGPGRLSPALAESVAQLSADVPFARARVLLEQLAGARLSSATVRRHTMALGKAMVAMEDGAVDVLEEGKTPPVAGPAQLQLSVDGAMVPLIGGKWAEVRTVAIGATGRGRESASDEAVVLLTADGRRDLHPAGDNRDASPGRRTSSACGGCKRWRRLDPTVHRRPRTQGQASARRQSCQ